MRCRRHSLEQPRSYFLPAPARQRVRIAPSVRAEDESLEFAARRENLGAHLKFGRA